MEPESLVPFSHELAIGPYPEPDKSNEHNLTLLP
jgi:hypothetical protein